jgi:hypothetical protein
MAAEQKGLSTSTRDALRCRANEIMTTLIANMMKGDKRAMALFASKGVTVDGKIMCDICGTYPPDSGISFFFRVMRFLGVLNCITLSCMWMG